MEKTDFIKRCINKRREILLKAIEKAKNARDNAPGAMESASDTRRSQAEKLVIVLEDQLKQIDKRVDAIDPSSLFYLEVEIDLVVKKFLIVSKDLGGVEMDGIRLLSTDSPLGQVLIGKKTGDSIEFNSQKLVILKSE